MYLALWHGSCYSWTGRLMILISGHICLYWCEPWAGIAGSFDW